MPTQNYALTCGWHGGTLALQREITLVLKAPNTNRLTFPTTSPIERANAMNSSTVLTWFSRLTVLLTLTAQLTFAQKITTFDFPEGLATTPTGISSSGRIVGYFGDQQAVAVRGFVRNAKGKFTSFDAPGSTYTLPTGVDQLGQIIGFYGDNLDFGYLQLGFLRNPGGTMDTFNGGTGTVTFPEDINALGQVVGYWVDQGQVVHGFLRNAHGTITSLDVGSGTYYGTYALGTNASGQITGSYFDDSTDFKSHGFLLRVDGAIETFDVPNAITTAGVAINRRGWILGSYTDSSNHGGGFLRRADGSIEAFHVRGATTTAPVAINSKGQVAGYYIDSSSALHGFLRDSDGDIKTFDVPHATRTVPTAMNSSGEITGVFYDANGDQHGFVRSPERETRLTD
jgi:hypothetical protein